MRIHSMRDGAHSVSGRALRGGLGLALLAGALWWAGGEAHPVYAQAAAGQAGATGGASKGIGLFTWVDEKGNYHMVDSLGAVPTKFRPGAKARAEKGELAGSNAGGNYTQVKGAGSGSGAATGGAGSGGGAATGGAGSGGGAAAEKPAAEGSGGGEPAKRDPATDAVYWRERRQAAELLRDEAVAGLQALEGETMRLRTLTPTGFQQGLLDVEQKRSQLELVKAGAERELNETIPADARRLGVPPGWLR